MYEIDQINTINREEEGMQQEQEALDAREEMQRAQYEIDAEEKDTYEAECHYSPSDPD